MKVVKVRLKGRPCAVCRGPAVRLEHLNVAAGIVVVVVVVVAVPGTTKGGLRRRRGARSCAPVFPWTMLPLRAPPSALRLDAGEKRVSVRLGQSDVRGQNRRVADVLV